MFSKSFEIDGVKGTFHTETGRHVFMKRNLLGRLGVTSEHPEFDAWYNFISSIAQGSAIETPFVWPDVLDTSEDIIKAFEAWQDLSGLVIRAWLDALKTVDQAPSDPDLTPGADPKNAVSQ